MINRPAVTFRFLAVTAAAGLVSSLIVSLASGCASGGASTANQTALDSYVQGVRAYQSGDTAAAMSNLKHAIDRKNDLVMARSMLGDLYRARSDYESAKEQYQVLANLDPYYYLNHYRLGLVYQLLEQFKEAAASYLRAINLKPDDPMSNMSLGTVYLSLDKPKDALPYARKAVQHAPNNAAAWVNLGLVLDANANYAESENAYRKALDLDSSLTLPRLYLGESLLQQKKFGEARATLQELVKVEDKPLYRKRLGDAYARDGKYEDALREYQTALKLDPNYYPALNEMGATYIAQYEKGLTLDDSQRKKALDAWEQSLAIKRAQPAIIALTQKYSKAASIQR
jgi:tetratricopeptide (TPR) repeat protein